MAPRLRLAEPDYFDSKALDELRQYFEVDDRPVAQSELGQALQECDVFWFRLGFHLNKELLSKATCKIIASPVTGINQIDSEACHDKGIRIVSLKGETDFLREVRATAEHTIGLLLSLLRSIPSAHLHATQGLWQRDLFKGSELYGKTVGIVGVGRLGSIVAEYLRALGMHVIGYDIRSAIPAWVTRCDSINELFSKSDVISVHVSLDDSTVGLIGNEQFKYCKPNALLINTARGAIVNEDALLDALNTAKIAGAATDVITNEDQIDASHPLIQYAKTHTNLIVTPHIGGNTKESFQKTERFLAKQVIKTHRSYFGGAAL